jgi:CO/xanthine dehydrogenase FAD-binding subunit
MLQTVATPGSLPETHALLSKLDSARIIAGGTAVMPTLNAGTDEFSSLVSLRAAGLSGIVVKDGVATIGAATTMTELADEPALAFLKSALETIASPTIRNMATIGGNLFVKQPYGDLAACLIALGATATVSDGTATRIEPVEKLVASRLGPKDIVTQLAFSIPSPGSFKFVKAGRKALNAAAIVTVAAVVSVSDGVVSQCRIGLGGVAECAVRARSVEEALTGNPLDRTHAEQAAAKADRDIEPFDDSHASAWYRARVTPVHIRRALVGE